MLRRAKPLLGTLVEVACEAADEATALQASQAAFAAVAQVHRCMSRHEAGSDLGRLNAAAPGAWLTIDTETVAVLALALALSRQTGGVFDVCASSAQGSWRELELDAANRRVRKHAPAQADLGGIAKGHAVDLAVAALRAAGADRGWVNAGGDVRVFGALALPLRVRAPWNLSQTLPCTILRNQAAATSASYLLEAPALRHGITKKTVDAHTSWTVTAPECIAADALTKLVAASGDARHPVLTRHGACAWVYHDSPPLEAA
ncbi:FAD:protein FMN transferase [Rhodoferax sediminis]|jgi:thiamine biosynthesis lipoprotein|uniref:FAD:protein FMN transferase n=1 Tax=Rhodoferax sediminis TaxID=2509614 RepID=A0A515DC62_9BURK|nr:FAD:protein FMN transferase [Rhodoferax sediminis]QDL37985.1 FAD:protein FMN transferase [Rhodoferax sediminis]